MNDQFNQFSSVRFPRTQPETWRSIPFAGERHNWRLAFKIIGIVLMWCALFALSLWSIAQGGM